MKLKLKQSVSTTNNSIKSKGKTMAIKSNLIKTSNPHIKTAKLKIENAIQTASRRGIDPKLIFVRLIVTATLNKQESDENRYSHLPQLLDVINERFYLDEEHDISPNAEPQIKLSRDHVDYQAYEALLQLHESILNGTISFLKDLDLTEDQIFELLIQAAIEYGYTITHNSNHLTAMLLESISQVFAIAGECLFEWEPVEA